MVQSKILCVTVIVALTFSLDSTTADDEADNEKEERIKSVGQLSNLRLRPSKDPDQVKFYLYGNYEDEDDRFEIQLNNYTSLVASGYNRSNPLVVLIHGVLSDSLTFPDVKVIKNEYLRGDCSVNVVMVDYGAITTSTLPQWLSALSYMAILEGANNTEVVGNKIVDLITFLMTSSFLQGPESVHLIGFSIGAHMAGLAGRNIFYRTFRKIGRITGLDPSPQFKSQHKLVEFDAEFVDVTLSSMAFLTKKKMFGHVQFYINGGGPHQPNCPNFSPFVDPYCSHVNSVYYYAKTLRRRIPTLGCRCESTRRCKRPPAFCNNTAVYGENVSSSARGNYYVSMT